jgi:hypothetical protein
MAALAQQDEHAPHTRVEYNALRLRVEGSSDLLYCKGGYYRALAVDSRRSTNLGCNNRGL